MIKKIKWDNHPMLHNLELDFQKEDGTPYNTIILAGENGVGKTTVLETLAAFLNLGTFEPFESIQYIADGSIFTITKNTTIDSRHGFHFRRNESTGDSAQQVRTNRSNNPNRIQEDLEDIRHYGFAYSKARSGFVTKAVKSSTTQQLDEEKYGNDNNDDFTPVKQLIIDITEQDNSEWMHITKSGSETSYEDFKQESKGFRFENAFNSFFENIKFYGVDEKNRTEKRILFHKHGVEITIDQLSTGEKQIVFRGAQLLKNMNGIAGGIVLVDEPELSMHPSWQQKILEYYRGLFTTDGTQSVQMFFATHSEHVLKSALEDRDNVLIIVLRENDGELESERVDAPSVLPSITSAETNYLAFNIISIDYHIELYAYLQNIAGTQNVKACDDYIVAQTAYYNQQMHGKPDSFTNSNGRTTTYQSLPTYIRNAIDHPDSGRSYTQEELRCSVELLIQLCLSGLT